jgi:hypothetical protein
MQAARQGVGDRALAGLARAATTVSAKTARLMTWDRLAAEAGFVEESEPDDSDDEFLGGERSPSPPRIWFGKPFSVDDSTQQVENKHTEGEQPLGESEYPEGESKDTSASGSGSRTCRLCITIQLGTEMFPASRCALCEGGPFHAACLYRGACVECGPVHPGMRAANTIDDLDAPWAAGDLVRAATGGLVHKVLTASAGLPASRWKTICGWAFAEGGLRPGPSEAAVGCTKCSGRKRAAE